MIPSEPPKLKARLPKKLKMWIEDVRDWMNKTQPINGPGLTVSETANGRRFSDAVRKAQGQTDQSNSVRISVLDDGRRHQQS